MEDPGADDILGAGAGRGRPPLERDPEHLGWRPVPASEGLVELSGASLTRAGFVAVARRGAPVELAEAAYAAMAPSAEAVARIAASEEPAYGVSTGFGSLANVAIPPERRAELQRALIRSHAAGLGPPVEREVVRGMMLLRARTLTMGYSGARPVVVERLLALLNAGIAPVVPEHGSPG